jgi:cytochrome b561
MRKEVNQKRLRKLEETAGICCFVAGLVAPVLGGLLTLIEWIVGPGGHPWLHVSSTAFFVIGIPLILFAGFCLDWAERGQKKTAHNPEQAQRGAASFAHLIIIASILGMGMLGPAAIQAQHTIVKVPTNDVLARSKV